MSVADPDRDSDPPGSILIWSQGSGSEIIISNPPYFKPNYEIFFKYI